MSYIEDLEKRVAELEDEVQFLSKTGEEAFLFRRVEKLVIKCIEDIDKNIENKPKDEHGELSEESMRLRIKQSAYRHILNDIEHTREDMGKYTLRELHSEDFFNF